MIKVTFQIDGGKVYEKNLYGTKKTTEDAQALKFAKGLVDMFGDICTSIKVTFIKS